MIELRPLLAPGETPLVLAAGPRPLLEGSVRPLCRGLLLAAALSLPALGPHAADRLRTPGVTRSEAARAAVAPSFPPTGGAARLALAWGAAR